MKKKIAVLLQDILALAAGSAMPVPRNSVVRGQETYPTNDIIDKDVNSADHTTLENAVKAAGLVHWLPGAFTVFAPSNEAFANREPVEAGE